MLQVRRAEVPVGRERCASHSVHDEPHSGASREQGCEEAPAIHFEHPADPGANPHRGVPGQIWQGDHVVHAPVRRFDASRGLGRGLRRCHSDIDVARVRAPVERKPAGVSVLKLL